MTEPDVNDAATCDRCGAVVGFEPPDSAVVIFSTSGDITTLCATCSGDADKERQWRATGVWVGDDLPPSLRDARPATPEELRLLLGESQAPERPPAADDGSSENGG